MKYRKKPIDVEAIIWTGDNIPEMRTFVEGKYYFKVGTQLFIPTLEGDMRVNKGDYIIKEPFDNIRGFYPCKPDIFEKTYEKVK